MQKPEMRLGAHVSIQGGLAKALERAQKIGANTFQIFSSPPRNWKAPDFRKEDVDAYKRRLIKTAIGPVFIHAKYLISLGNKDQRINNYSVRSLLQDLKLCSEIGAQGVIFHPQGEDLKLLSEKVKEVLSKSPGNSTLIVENKAQSKISRIAHIFEQVSSPRLKLCLDTAHAFQAGHPMRTKEDMDKLLKEVEKEIGILKLVVIHANDSKTKEGSRHDKHEVIAEGEIGELAFVYLLHHPKTRDLPFIIETPDLKKGAGRIESLERLKQMVKKSYNVAL